MKARAVSALAALSLAAAAPVVTISNPVPALYTTPDGEPTGVQIAPTGSIIVGDDTAGAQITSLNVCFDKSFVFWQWEEAIVCPPKESLAPANLQCVWTDGQLNPQGGCVLISGPASTNAYSTIAYQVRYINSGPWHGVTRGPRRFSYVATDSNNVESAPAYTSINVVGDQTIEAQCPTMSGTSGVPDQTTNATIADVSANTKFHVLSTLNVTSPNMLVEAHIRITAGCIPAEDAMVLDYAGGAPLSINSQWFPDTCDLTLTAAAGLPDATWTQAIQFAAFQSQVVNANATAGYRAINVFVSQQDPAVCNTEYNTAVLNIVEALPSATPTMTPSPSSSSASTPVSTPTATTPEAPPASGAAAISSAGIVGTIAVAAAMSMRSSN